MSTGQQAPSVAALQGALNALRELVADLPVELYCTTASAVSGSVGEHVRHCLDHVRALVSARGRLEFSYDSRARGTVIERDPAAAAIEIDKLCLDLDALDPPTLDRAVWVRAIATDDGRGTTVATSIGREAVFVLHHTIHHCALIAVLLDVLAVRVPASFGVAPSTLMARQ
jgi:hypothetical protein